MTDALLAATTLDLGVITTTARLISSIKVHGAMGWRVCCLFYPLPTALPFSMVF